MSWKLTFIMGYVLCIALYVFIGYNATYYNMVSYSVFIFLGILAVKQPRLTLREKEAIDFIVVYKALCLGYLFLIALFDIDSVKYSIMTFTIMMVCSTFLAWLFSTRRYGKV